MFERVLVKLYNTGDGVLTYLYLVTWFKSVVLFLLHHLHAYFALQHVDTGVAQIFAHKIF